LGHHPARKRADFPRVLTDGNRQPTGSGGKADRSRVVTPVVRPPPSFGSRPCRSTVQVDPKANGATASRKRCRGPAEPRPIGSRRDVVQCLSCMCRNGTRAVLRGGGAGDSTSLPDSKEERRDAGGPGTGHHWMHAVVHFLPIVSHSPSRAAAPAGMIAPGAAARLSFPPRSYSPWSRSTTSDRRDSGDGCCRGTAPRSCGRVCSAAQCRAARRRPCAAPS
jgi:hypothetical protein